MMIESDQRRSDLSPAKRALLEKRLRGDRKSAVNRPATIPRRAGNGDAPLSFAQRQIWFAQQLAPNSPLYHLSQVFRLEGRLDGAVLERSIAALVSRHEALRTRFVSQEGEPRQIIDATADVPLHRLEVSAAVDSGRPAEIQRAFRPEIERPFDLGTGPLWRVALLPLGPSDHALCLTMHHIISDGWSMEILWREMMTFYAALASKADAGSALPELPIQYADFALWQHQWMRDPSMQREIGWWKDRLAGAPGLLPLPTDRPRPSVQKFLGHCRWRSLPRSLADDLKALGGQEGATLFMTLLATFQIFLHRLTGAVDLLLGSPSAGRNQSETENLIGLFANVLVVRSELSGNPTFRQFLQGTRETTLDAYAHSDLPFEKLIEELHPPRAPSHSPLVQVLFSLQHRAGRTPEAAPELAVTPISDREVDTGTAKFDLTFQMEESADGLSLFAEYNSALFDETTIDRFLGHFQTLLEGAVRNPDCGVKSLPLLTSTERQQLVVDWNQTQAAYPRDKSLAELFTSQARQNPSAVAVTFQGRAMTYRELDERTNQLARHLRRLGIAENQLVAVCLERSIEMIVSILGILKAGAAYIPLDPAYPPERLTFMLEDSGATLLLISPTGARGFPPLNHATLPQIVRIDPQFNVCASEESTAGDGATKPVPSTQRAYVIYTSGSTGQPKGVCISHRAVVRIVFGTNYLQIQNSDVVAHLASCAFDAATFEIWGALLRGARLAILPTATVLSPQALAQAIVGEQITTMFVTTALFNQLAREVPNIFKSVRNLLFGGETANVDCLREVLRHERPGRLLHMYGPTEATTFATWYEVENLPAEAQNVPIGRAIANTELYILDDERQPVPIGVTGELYIGGDGLANGYLNRPELTAEKFVPHPFSEKSGDRLYRSGDLVRARPDGNLEFVGRVDTQIKIRGFRIEPGEIEAVIRQHPHVQDCLVTVVDDGSDNKRLVAYVVGDLDYSTEALQDFLRSQLPEYMLPGATVVLPALPLNANGKVDRQALPTPIPGALGHKGFVAPHGELESQLAQIWQDLLGIPTIGAADNFFELGGHSLLAIRLLARIEKVFGKVLPVTAILQSPTIEQLAARIRDETTRKTRTPPASSSIVEIQSTGSKPPLYLVHGAGGGMFWGYTNLARHLGTDQPVYGFKSRDDESGTSSSAASIEEMAAQFVADLRAFQPVGPYHLGGYCFGGNIAHEMARQLQAVGQHVALLALMNSTPTDSSSDQAGDVSSLRQFARFCENVRFQVGCFVRRPQEEQRRVLAWQWRSLKRKIGRRLARPSDAKEIEADEFVDLSGYSPEQRRLWEMHVRALIGHRTEPYSGEITLLRSRGYHSGLPLDDAYGWNAFARGVTVHIVPGAHDQILNEPHVQTLAEKLKSSLEEVHRDGSSSNNGSDPNSSETSAAPPPPAQSAQPDLAGPGGSATKNSPINGAHKDASSPSPSPSPALAPYARWNATQSDYPRDKCVHQLFEEQARRTPDVPAVICHHQILSYRQLDQRADQLATMLRELKVGPDVPVGLCLDRTPEMVLGVLAVLKAGGPYVPLDPAYPRERLQLMLDNTRAPVLITRRSLADCLPPPAAGRHVIWIDELDLGDVADIPATREPKVNPEPHHLAYVIHTSGSTGTPKGVAMPHQPLVNLIEWQRQNSKLRVGARTLQFSSLSFDVSFQEMFSTWSTGGTLVLIDDDLRRDPFALLRFITEEKIERLFLPFVALQQLAEADGDNAPLPVTLREVVTAGEQLHVTPAIARFFTKLPEATLFNQYGPTESHVVTAYALRGKPADWPALPPIGRPIANTVIHVLDADLRPVAIGAAGELYIGGDCLARGYLHRPDLTEERFIRHPFCNEPGARLYRTGDRARWLADGEIEFLGRVDQQVKIRGYRIELSEVEAALGRCPGVQECAVIADNGPAGEKRLVAYVVNRKKEDIGESELRTFLQKGLPEYMVPSVFVFLDALPLTPTGKVNRRALPAPSAGQLRAPAAPPEAPPRTPTETILSQIWRDVLGIPQIGVTQNFFELGGHSLLAVQLVKRIAESFGRQLMVSTIFQFPTIAKLAGVLDQRTNSSVPTTSIVEIQPHGSKPPLFLVHGAGGGMFWGYANLARHLGNAQPLFAFKSRGLDGVPEHESISGMAAAYVSDLRAFQPHGPYRLGGYCFGGIVAHEMARQLEALGEKVSLLAVFNAWPAQSTYTQPHISPRLCLKFLRNVSYWIGYTVGLKPAQQRELLLWKAKAMARKCLGFAKRLRMKRPDIDLAQWVDLSHQPKDRHALWATHVGSYLAHQPGPFAGHLTLFRTRCHPLWCSFDDACGWGEFALGGVTSYVVPGAHESVLDEPHVAVLARELEEALRLATTDARANTTTTHPNLNTKSAPTTANSPAQRPPPVAQQRPEPNVVGFVSTAQSRTEPARNRGNA